MAISFVGASASSSFADNASPFANTTFTLHNATTAGNMVLLNIPVKPYSTIPGTPTGYTQLATITNGTAATVVDGGSNRCTVFYREFQSGDSTSVSVPWSDQYVPTQPVGSTFSKSLGNPWIVEATTGSQSTTGNISVTGAATLNLTTDDMIVVCIACSTDVLHSSGSISATGATFGTLDQRILDPNTISADDLSVYMYTASVTSGTATAAPVFTATASGNSGLVSVVFVRLSDASGALSVSCQSIIASSTILSPAVDQDISMQVINTSSTLFNPDINQDINVAVIGTTSTVFSPSVNMDVVVPLITTTSTVFTPSSSMDIDTTTISAPSTVFSPTLDYNVVFPVINALETVYTPATDTSVNVEGQLITTTSTVFNPELNQDINLAMINAPTALNNFDVTSAGGDQAVNIQVVGTTSSIPNPTVTTLTTVTAQVLNAPSTIQAPALKYDVEVPAITTSSTLFTPSLEYLIELQTINTAPNIHAPRIGDAVDEGFSGAIIKPNNSSPFPSGIR